MKNNQNYLDFKVPFQPIKKVVKEQIIKTTNGLHVATIQLTQDGSEQMYTALNRNGTLIGHGDYPYLARKILEQRIQLIELAQTVNRLEQLHSSKAKAPKEKETPARER